MGMGQTLSLEIHRQHCPCGIRRSLPDGALFLCSSYCYADVVRGIRIFRTIQQLVLLRFAVIWEKVRFSNLSTTISHTATLLHAARSRENITEKLARVPMGTILDTPSGQYKTTIVDG